MEFKCFANGPFTTNTYLVYQPGTRDGFIIDPATGYQPLLEAVKALDIDLKYIMLTHGHSDHTGGLNFFKEHFPEVKIVASELERETLASRKMSFAREAYAADIEVADGQTLEIGSLKPKFISTPGHTPGGMCILLENCLFCGDTLFFNSIGRTDLWGGNTEKIISSIKEKLLVLPADTKCFPGHGGATTIGYEKENNPFVQD